MKIIKQSTYETCLSCSLLMITGKTKRDEIEIWKHGWKFNYLIGQLNYFSKKYKQKFTAYIENKYYFNQLQDQKEKNIELINKKVDLKLLKKLLKNGKVIVYLDCFYFYKILHAPHFVVAIKMDNNFVEIADPGDEKIKKIPVEIIKKGISSLRNHLKYSPVLVTISE